MRSLTVFFQQHRVGHARADDQEHFSFAYDQEWLANPDAFPISIHLPLREERWSSSEAHPFFANLLPEGPARQAICRRLGISVDNDAALLAAIGDDTAGALRIVASRGTPEANSTPGLPTPIADEDLVNWSNGEPAILSDPALPPRLSLAGAQHKISVVLTKDKDLAIAPVGEPSTHLLKFDAHGFAHLAANEFLTTNIAAELGLSVTKLHLDDRTSRPFLVIERYDRIVYETSSEGDGPNIARLHQEDFCQAFGLPPTRKYQDEGGPSLNAIAKMIRKYSAAPAADLLRLARWAIFCAVCGNADGHAKNLSLLYGPSGIRLAPFYDLVCTRAYEGLDFGLAIAIGGQRDPDKLRLQHLHQLGDDLGIRPRLVEREADRILANLDDAFQRASSTLDGAIGFSPAVERVERAIQKRARSIGNNISQDRA